MGIGTDTVKFLVHCKASGADYTSTVTLGRQALYTDKRDVAYIFQKNGIPCDDDVLEAIFGDSSLKDLKIGFAENLFHAIGAETVEAIDASDYEGASIVHDMNIPVPSEYERRFTAVVDSGTLEHIFNFPVAIENCMKMLKNGGHFISAAPANNICGHGFYQFSPELFFRVFCKQNGFLVTKAFLCATQPFGAWFEIPDPSSLRERIEFSNQVPTVQLFLAQKISDDARIHVLPQQSDYEAILWKGESDGPWTAHGDARLNRRLAFNRQIAARLPRPTAEFLKALRSLVMGAIKPPFGHPSLRKFIP